MTDEPRDAELGAALRVPPLDETTRRRLIRSAVAALPTAGDPDSPGSRAPGSGASRSPRRMGAAIGVAAALLVGAVVGAIVVTSPQDPETTTAAKAPSTEPTTAAVEGAAPAPQSADEVASAPTTGVPAQALTPQDLGELGTVTGEGGLRRAISTAFQKAESERSAATGDTGIPCRAADPARLGLVLITAAGTADFDGTPVVVLVGPTPAGENVAVVQDPGRGCETLRRVTL